MGQRPGEIENSFFGPIRLGDELDFFSLPAPLQTPELALALGIERRLSIATDPATGASPPTLVCGSPFETANDPFLGGSVDQGAFDAYTEVFQTSWGNKA